MDETTKRQGDGTEGAGQNSTKTQDSGVLSFGAEGWRELAADIRKRAECPLRRPEEYPTCGEAIGGLLLDIARRVEEIGRRTDNLLDRALSPIEERLADLRYEYKAWAGRETAGHARGLKADIDECEAILAEARGEMGKGGADGAAPAKQGRETVTDCHGLGNVAKLRAAVEGIEMLLGAGGDLDRKELAEECARALAAPPRNCDVGTAREQAVRKAEYCLRYAPFADSNCDACPLRNYNRSQPEREVGYSCDLAWAQLPYEAAQEGGAK